MEEITYEQAKEAKQILLKYIDERGIDYISKGEIEGDLRNEVLLFIALTQMYFLE